MAAILKFEENKPETIALMFSEGKNVIDGYQHEQVMFTLADQRLMFVTPDVANRIRLLDVKPQQTFVICKRKKGRMNQWDLWLSPETAAFASFLIQSGRATHEAETALGHLYETRTPAEVLSGHTAVVWLFGKAGCVALDALSDCPHTLITEGLRRGLFAPGQVTKKS